MMLSLQRRGCPNINLVTPTHYVAHILKARAKPASGYICEHHVAIHPDVPGQPLSRNITGHHPRGIRGGGQCRAPGRAYQSQAAGKLRFDNLNCYLITLQIVRSLFSSMIWLSCSLISENAPFVPQSQSSSSGSLSISHSYSSAKEGAFSSLAYSS